MNKILLTFLLVIVLSFAVVWKFVQSETFAKILSNTLTQVSKEKFGADIGFEKLGFKFFPPGAEVYNLKVRYEKSGNKIELDALRAGVSFDLLDSFETDLTIRKVYFYESEVKIKKNESSETKEKSEVSLDEISPRKITKEIFSTISKKMPVKIRNIQLVDLNLEIEDRRFYIRNLDSEINDTQLDLYLQIDNINLKEYIKKDLYLDRVSIEVNIKKDELQIRDLNIKERYNNINLAGSIKLKNKIKDSSYNIKSKVEFDLADIQSYVDISSVGSIREGTVNLFCDLKGVYSEFNTDCFLKLDNFESDFVYGDHAELKLTANNKRISVNDFELKAPSQSAKLVRPFEFYNFEKKSFIDEPIILSADGLKFNNALRALRKQLSPLKGDIHGEVRFTLGKKDFHFYIDKTASVKNLALVIGDLEIVGTDELFISKASFDISGTDIYMEIDSNIKDTILKVKGGVADSVASFKISDSYVNFDEFHKIAKFQMKGKGPLELSINSPINDTVLNLKSTLSDFEFERYQLENLESEINIDLSKNTIQFVKAEGTYGRSTLSADGALNLKTSEIGVEVRHKVLFYNDLRKIYYPLQKDLTFLPERFLGEMAGTITLGGKASLEELKVYGKLGGKNLYAYSESFDSLDIEFLLENKFLNFRYINLKKSNGEMLSIVGVDLDSGKVDIRGNMKSVSLSELNNFLKLPIQVRGNLDGTYSMLLDNGIKKVDAQVYLNKTSIEGEQTGDSFVDINYSSEKIRASGQLFDNIISWDGLLDLSEKFWSVSNSSKLKAELNIGKLEKYMPMIIGINDTNNLRGKLNASVVTSFNYANLKSLSLDLYIKELMLKKSKVDLHYLGSETKSLVSIVNSEIKNWDFNIRGDNIYLISQGNGNFLDEYDIKSRLKIESSILEIFDGFINQSSGILIGKLSSFNKNNKEDFEAILTTNNMSISSDFIPTQVKSSKIKLSYKDRSINLDEFTLDLNSGSVDVNGQINFKNLIPEMALRYKVNQAELNFFKKTSLDISGEGSIIGSTRPYTISGDLSISGAQMFNEFSEIEGSGSVGLKKVKYLPESSGVGFNNLFGFNISILSKEPIIIRNTMADLAFNANLQLLGNEIEPKLSGKVSLIPGNNILVFQNNEFKLSRGDILFNEASPISDPEVDFVAASTISKYNISARVYGPVSEYNTSLTSDPVLPQQNILSLIAFGYTEDVSDNLTDVEKESITRAGIGSLLFDSFKINQTLKSEFGVQVNLGTEISRDEGSYLSQRNPESNNVGRVRSATKIEVKKDITKDVSMSVTSTVGGTSGERQSMNLNYNINNKYSLEGVYQSQTSDEEEQDVNATSIGADFKIKWSFK